jgi:para-nitrobenzyl esterase
MTGSDVFAAMAGAGIDQSPTAVRRERSSEDCLKLHVFTPGLGDGARRPIMVWMHGGGFGGGSAVGHRADGGYLAREEDVVVVSMHHRLGALGYAHFGELFGDDYAESGNAGQLDLIACLEWVQAHADAIGGDAGNVTIFGESGGGQKICTLLAMSKAEPLFHKAIVQSAPAVAFGTPELATMYAEALLAELGLTPRDLTKLQAVEAVEIRDAEARVPRRLGAAAASRLGGFVPVVGTTELPLHPFEPNLAPTAREKPMIIGGTREEAALFLAADPALETLSEDDVHQRVSSQFGTQADKIMATYRTIMPSDMTPTDAWIWMQTSKFRMDAIAIAESKARDATTPVWMYLFEWRSPAADGRVRSAHGVDTPFVFGCSDVVRACQGPDEPRLRTLMSTAWANFARSGDPATDAQPWPAYDLSTRTTLCINNPPAVVNDPYAEERELWNIVGSDGMASIF